MEHWKEKPTTLSKDSKEYIDFMALYLKPFATKPRTTIQAASTQRVLYMTDEELEEYHKRPLPDNWKGEEIERSFDPKQVSIIERMRQSGKNTQGDAMSSGGGFSSTFDTKVRAISAFTCTPPAELTPKQKKLLTALQEIEMPEKKLSLLERIKEKVLNIKSKFTTSTNKHGDIIYNHEDNK